MRALTFRALSTDLHSSHFDRTKVSGSRHKMSLWIFMPLLVSVGQFLCEVANVQSPSAHNISS